MKSLSEIYYSHKNWLEDEEHPHCQKEEVIHTEMYEEADQYVKELTTIPHNWKNVLMHDVSRMNPYDRVTRYWLYDVWKELEEYLDITYDCNDGGLSDNEYKYLMHIELVEYFLDTVQGAIYRYFGEDINLVEYLRQKAIDEEKQPADTSTPSAELMEDATDLTPAIANNEKQEKGKAGKKPAKDFREYFLPGIDADILLPILHEYIDGKVGKELAKYIVAITNELIEEPSHKSVCKEFKASESAYKEAIDKHYCRNQYTGVRKDKIGKPFPEYELAIIRNNIKKRIEKINGDTSTS